MSYNEQVVVDDCNGQVSFSESQARLVLHAVNALSMARASWLCLPL